MRSINRRYIRMYMYTYDRMYLMSVRSITLIKIIISRAHQLFLRASDILSVNWQLDPRSKEPRNKKLISSPSPFRKRHK